MTSALEPPALDRPPSFGRERVSDGVTVYLRDLIMSGQLRAGEPLRVEHLATLLTVSVTPIRESLVDLLGEGFVERAPRRGYSVARLTRADISDVFIANAMLAGELAARAAARMGTRQVGLVTELQAKLEKAGRRKAYAEMEELNHQLHRAINAAAMSPKLALFVQRTSHYAPRWTWSTIAGWPKASAEDHVAIVNALRAGDTDVARESMQEHIQHSGDLLVEHLEATGFWEAGSSPRSSLPAR